MSQTLRGRRIALAAVLMVGLYLGYRVYESRLDAAALRDETLEGAIPSVSVTHAKPSAPTETITLPGNVSAWFLAPIYAQVSGYVKMWHKDYGAQVKTGDMLAEINAPALDAQYEQAKADLEAERAKYALAEVTAKRWIAMRKSHAVSEQSITVQEQNMKAQAAVVKASDQKVKNYEALIRFKTIVAPFDGVVTVRNINVGDYVNKEGTLSTAKDSNLFTVADVSRMRLFVSVPESFGSFLQPGLTADVIVPQIPGRHFIATFLTVARGFDPDTRTAITEFTIENEDRALWPGSYATVRLTVPIDRKLLTIPSSALVFQESGTQVAVVKDDGRLHFQSITVSKILDATVEVTEGISPSDRIVNNPSAALLEGDKVRIVTPAPGYEVVTTEAAGSKEPKEPSSKASQ